MHFSNEASNEKFLLVDLQGADYKLYDREIATIETLIVSIIFYTGNLRRTAIYNCFTAHKCNVICLGLKMAEVELGKSEEDEA